MSMFGKIFWAIICVFLVVVAIFCVVVVIMSSIHNVSFIEEIKSWVDTAETTKEATNAALSIMFRK